MDDSDFRQLSKNEIDDFISWFQENFSQSPYLNSDMIKNILINYVSVDNQNKFVFNEICNTK